VLFVVGVEIERRRRKERNDTGRARERNPCGNRYEAVADGVDVHEAAWWSDRAVRRPQIAQEIIRRVVDRIAWVERGLRERRELSIKRRVSRIAKAVLGRDQGGSDREEIAHELRAAHVALAAGISLGD